MGQGQNTKDKPKTLADAIEQLENSGAKEALRNRLEQELNRVEESLKRLKPHLENLSEQVSSEAKKAKEKVEKQVSKNPWSAIGVVGLIFFLLGLFLGYKGSRRSD